MELFKIETDDNKIPLDNVMFYGISAKRYCLYSIVDDKIELLKHSTHGLGYLKNIDGKQIWEALINKNFENYKDAPSHFVVGFWIKL